ncbi:hypothetical protein K504DRAFT_449624 [Pleomassaria siparia CBS 279.74]|uniref:Chromosome condensation protein-like protein n=1 Tax=Pleomassaria siparia CBS 279.74 TaxID=1314801 RepID=A0A6G1KKB5_9PLEO|nr:hypothetical protein K504DRAFT_449624 [Pleomassaria siparia CBS 279.74]
MERRKHSIECADADADAFGANSNLDGLAVSSPPRESSKRRPRNYQDDFDEAESDLLERNVDQGVANLDELAAPAPDENPGEGPVRYHRSLEEEEKDIRQRRSAEEDVDSKRHPTERESPRERLLWQLYIYSWLVLFSIFGTLARLGVEWLTSYPNAPVTTNVLWANFGGSLVLGFLQEDRVLFAEERNRDALDPHGPSSTTDHEKEKKREMGKRQAELLAAKKAIPMYIGLSVGFCGSFTSFSSFMRDLFLGLSNDLVGKQASLAPRSAGWSVCSVLGIATLEVTVSLSALALGAHVAIALFPLLCKIPKMNSARFMNPLAIILGFGCWLGAVFLAIWPIRDRWRGQVVFALVFSPLGCILRYQLSLRLNGISKSFPLGTFAANIFGTAVLGLAYALQHAPLYPTDGKIGGGILGCQILAGITEGFCGCLTTISTWVSELRSLRKHHAYVYGTATIVLGFSFVTVIIGSVHWTIGISQPACTLT